MCINVLFIVNIFNLKRDGSQQVGRVGAFMEEKGKTSAFFVRTLVLASFEG